MGGERDTRMQGDEAGRGQERRQLRCSCEDTRGTRGHTLLPPPLSYPVSRFTYLANGNNFLPTLVERTEMVMTSPTGKWGTDPVSTKGSRGKTGRRGRMEGLRLGFRGAELSVSR